jgi:hypothetical protein
MAKVYVVIVENRHRDGAQVKIFSTAEKAQEFYDSLPDNADSKWDWDKENSYPPKEVVVE